MKPHPDARQRFVEGWFAMHLAIIRGHKEPLEQDKRDGRKIAQAAFNRRDEILANEAQTSLLDEA